MVNNMPGDRIIQDWHYRNLSEFGRCQADLDNPKEEKYCNDKKDVLDRGTRGCLDF